MQNALRIALLIDADNASVTTLESVLQELARSGKTNVRRAYGNWKSPHLGGWEEALHLNAIRPMQQFALSKGKNASDMALTIDAMDLLYEGHVDAFAIMSSDADFTPLVLRLRQADKQVFGFGTRATPEPFSAACTRFLYTDEPAPAAGKAATAKSQRWTRKELCSDSALVAKLKAAVDATKGESGWSTLAEVGDFLKNRGSFDSRNYGYARLGELIEETKLFEVKRPPDGAGTAHVREARAE